MSKPNVYTIPTLAKLGIFFAILICPMLGFAKTASEFINEAQGYVAKGDKKAAVIQLKNALKEEPANVDARLMLGKLHLELGDPSSAEKELDRVRQLKVSKERWLAPLLEALILQGKFRDVIEHSDSLDKDKLPNDVLVQAMVFRGTAQMSVKQLAEAEKTFDQALKVKADSNAALLGKARLAAIKNNLDQASALADKAVQQDDKDLDAWIVKAEISRLRKDYQGSKAAYQRAAQINPESAQVLLGAATTSILLKEYESAKQNVAKILKNQPSNPYANYLNAIMAYENKDFDSAEASLQQVLRVASDHAGSLRMMGTIHFIKGRYEQADEALSQYFQRAQGDSTTYALYAMVKLKLKQPEQAIKSVESALKESPKNPHLLSLMGAAYLQKGQPDKGFEYLEKATEVAPDISQFRSQLGYSYMAMGDMDKAISQLESAVKLENDIVPADLMLAVAYFKKGEYENAYKAAGEIVQKQPKNPLGYNLMGAASLGLNKKDEARKYFQQALKIDPNFVTAEMNLAALAQQENRLSEAQKGYRAVLKKDPKHVNAMLALARMAEKAGDDKQANDWLLQAWNKSPGIVSGSALTLYYLGHNQGLKALKIARAVQTEAPGDPRALYLLGSAQLRAGEEQSAVITFRQLVDKQPTAVQSHLALAQALIATNDIPAAKKSFQEAIKLQSDNGDARLGLISFEVKAGNHSEALKHAKELQSSKNNDVAIAGYTAEAEIYLDQKQYAKSVQAYEVAAKHAPNNPALIQRLSMIKAMSGDKEGATIILKDWLKKHPEDNVMRISLASIYSEMGRKDAAIAEYEQGLAKEPNNPVILNNLAWYYHERGDARAYKYAEQAYKIAPDVPMIADTYAWILVQRGEAKKAVPILQKVVAQAQNQYSIRYHYAVALDADGKHEQARRELESLMKVKQDFTEAQQAQKLLNKLQAER